MNIFKITNSQNELLSVSETDLENLLQKANFDTGENNFDALKSVEKLKNYLEIFLLNPQNTLTQKQLLDLTSQILNEQGFFQTAENFVKNFAQFSPGQKISQPAVIQGNFSRIIQEKLLLLYSGKQEKNLSFDQLLEKISQNHCSGTVSSKILDLLNSRKFFPHHNVLKNKLAFDQQYLNLADDLNDIFDGVKQLAVNFQNNTSTYINFSRLRPKLSPIKSTQGVSTGPVSFIKIFTSAYDALRQNLQNDFNIHQNIILNIHHPDILEYLIFIKNFQKQNSNRNFHFLIEITPAFKEALQKEEDFELINPQTRQTINYLSAKNTFDLIISTIEENPLLGLLNLQENDPTSVADNLMVVSGVLNLSRYAKNQKLQENDLKKDLKIIQQYLKAQSEGLKGSSLIQINLTGLADLLIQLRTSFASVQSIELIGKLIETIKDSLEPETTVSANLGSPLLSYLETSKGLETHNNLVISKTSLSGQESFQIIPELMNILQQLNLTSSDLFKQIFENNSLQSLYQIPSEIKALFLTSYELDSQFHLNLQNQFEQGFHLAFDKKIYLESNLDQEKLKTLIIDSLNQNLYQFRYCTFNNLISSEENPAPAGQQSNPQDKNFLLNLSRHRRRRSQQIQPPLFQIKKTEEVVLPPIVSNNQNQ